MTSQQNQKLLNPEQNIDNKMMRRKKISLFLF